MTQLQFELTSPLYLHVRGRQIEGTISDGIDLGIWPISATRVARGWGNASLTEWPYAISPDNWPPKEPKGIDSLAKTRRVNLYQRVRSADECSRAIHTLMPVTASFEITNLWFDAPAGAITVPPATEPIIGGHGVCVAGVEPDKELFHFVNSWGDKWGDKGFGTISFEYFDRYITEAWAMSGYAEKPPIPKYSPGVQYLNWGKGTFDGSVFHAMEVYDYSQDERMGWAFAVERDGWVDVEELFVRPAYRRNGHGRNLMIMLGELQDLRKLPVRFWMSHPDCTQSNLLVAERLLARFGFTIQPSGVRWASGMAVVRTPTQPNSVAVQPPKTPRIFRPANLNLQAN